MMANGFTRAEDFGFAPDAPGAANAEALQRALDRGGTVTVTSPGIYDLGATVYIGAHTALQFGRGVSLRKAGETSFTHALLNRGALTKTWDEDIRVEGLRLLVNGMDVCRSPVKGLRGQLAFHYVRDLRLTGIRIPDLGAAQYGIHVCTFEDLCVRDAIIRGKKDGVHLGRGKRFLISECVFQTFDDAVALNGHDYDTGNPELGWIENGVVEKCYDLDEARTTGFFCRILAGAWRDWYEGMPVQKSDTVVSEGRLYRVFADSDGQIFHSHTQPTFAEGERVLDGICWAMVQRDAVYTAGVRNVTFRDIFLEKPRIGFSVHFDRDQYSRSFYPGAPVPRQEHLVFDNVRVLHEGGQPFLHAVTPVDSLTLVNCALKDNPIVFENRADIAPMPETRLDIAHCDFSGSSPEALVRAAGRGGRVTLRLDGRDVALPE